MASKPNPIFPIIQHADDNGLLKYRRVPALSRRYRLSEETAFRTNVLAPKFLDLCWARAADHDHDYSALLIDRLGHTLRLARGVGFDFSAHSRAFLYHIPSND